MYSEADLNLINNILNNPWARLVFLLLIVWGLIWKGVALWKAAHNNQGNWFISLLIINTFGILEIIYLFYFCRPKSDRTQKV